MQKERTKALRIIIGKSWQGAWLKEVSTFPCQHTIPRAMLSLVVNNDAAEHIRKEELFEKGKITD